MSEEVSIPKLGVSMTEATILEWLVAEGDTVDVGTPLYMLETNKAEIEVTSDAAGVVVPLVAAGETRPVGAVVAEIRPVG